MTELVADFLFYYTLVSLGLAFLLVALTVLLTFRDKHVMLALIFADLSIFAVVSTVGQSPLTNLVITVADISASIKMGDGGAPDYWLAGWAAFLGLLASLGFMALRTWDRRSA